MTMPQQSPADLRRNRRDTFRAQPSDGKFDVLRTKSLRQPYCGTWRKIFQAEHRVAGVALKMRMFTVMTLACGIKSPGAVVTGDAMRQFLTGQPFQHSINGDPVHAPPAVNPLFQFLVGQRAVCRE